MTTFAAPRSAVDEQPVSHPLAGVLAQHIREAAWNAPRSQQRSVGPSEIGDPCARRLAYRLEGAETVNRTDPWPATVGTAVHAWLEDVFRGLNMPGQPPEWIVEQRVYPDDTIGGSCDLFHVPTCTVIDWKVLGTTSHRKYRLHGPPDRYRVQAHLYGKGWARLGFPVQHVALAMLSRPGWLTDLHVWSQPYDEAVADAGLDRLAQISSTTALLDLEQHPERFALVPGDPDGCRFCPFHRPGPPADGTGCPGT